MPDCQQQHQQTHQEKDQRNDGVRRTIHLCDSLSSEPLTETFDIETLHTLRHQTIAEQRRDQPWEVAQRQRLQSHHRSQRREWNVDPDRHNHRGGEQHRQRRPALDKRNFLRSQHMHHQRLRQQPFNKPPGLEQRLGLNVICRKHVPHQREGGDIKNGRRWANPQHKTADILRIPLARLTQKLFVHFVPRQRELGEIVHQVLD